MYALIVCVFGLGSPCTEFGVYYDHKTCQVYKQVVDNAYRKHTLQHAAICVGKR